MLTQDIHHLNTALKGEHMAIESFDFFILDTKDDIKKDKLMSIQRRHKNQATRLADKIQQLGGKPINSAGIVGTFSDIKHKLNIPNHKEEDILTQAIEGEKLGLDAFKRLIDEVQDEDNKILLKDLMIQTRGIVDDLINFQR